MCRMIAAVGRFPVEPLIGGLRSMSLNENPAYDHEHRSLGRDVLHDCGWGAAFLTPHGLSIRRSTLPCFADGLLEALVAELRAPGCAAHPDGRGGDATFDPTRRMLILHARRTRQRDTIALENTHPFRAAWRGVDYAFCHNGEVRNLAQLDLDARLSPSGAIDSERLFLHLLSRFDPDRPLGSVVEPLRRVRDFTCLNCFMATGETVIAHARMAPGSTCPLYYTLWRGRGEEFEVASSEVITGLDVEWSAVPDGSAFVLGAGL